MNYRLIVPFSILFALSAVYIGTRRRVVMPSLNAIRAANAAFSPAYAPVAFFVGGTSGIGQGMAEAFAHHTNGHASIVIIGRNRVAAESIIAKFPKPATEGVKYEFVQCDVTLMKNVHKTTAELLPRFPKINFLVLTPGILSMKGRDETEEGIDRKLALHYYTRWLFTKNLLPALRKASDDGEDAKVYSVLAAGKGGKIDLNDLGLKKTFSLANAALATPTYNDLMLEEFAAQNPELSFTHAYPGLVRTPLAQSSDSWLIRSAGALTTSLGYFLAFSPEECGERHVYSMFRNAKGFFRTGSMGEDIGMKKYFGSPEARKKLWEHTVEATTVN